MGQRMGQPKKWAKEWASPKSGPRNGPAQKVGQGMGQHKKWDRNGPANDGNNGDGDVCEGPCDLLEAMFGRVIGWALKFRASNLEQRGLGYGSKDDGIKLFAHTFIHATTRLSAGRQMP